MRNSLSERIIRRVQRGDYEVIKHEESYNKDSMIKFYTIDSEHVHIAVWPHWNVVSGIETHKRFYLLRNPAYSYLNSYQRDMQDFER